MVGPRHVDKQQGMAGQGSVEDHELLGGAGDGADEGPGDGDLGRARRAQVLLEHG